jgi:glycosyltransferase involved in cell wall biosynthesis
MTMTFAKQPNLVIDIAPLWELHFTGISNVVRELALRALNAREDKCRFKFSAFEHIIDRSVIEDCVDNLNGGKLRALIDSGDAKRIAQCDEINLKKDMSLFLHVKPPLRRFRKEAHLYYDLSYLSVPESHAEDTIRFHLDNLSEQIETTDQFFAISKSTAMDLQWFFNIPEDKIKVTYLGHNTDIGLADEFISRSFGRSAEPYVMCLGTIEPRKNVSLLLAWLAHNRAILERCRFVFCGRDGWGQSMTDLIAAHGLGAAYQAGRILHFGYVSQKQKAALLSAAQLLIYPSLFEGFGLPVLEAMAQSVPVLASCSTSIPEILGEDGIYFDPHSLDSFTAAFSQFVQEQRDGTLKARVKRLRKRSESFTYDGMFRDLIDTMLAL